MLLWLLRLLTGSCYKLDERGQGLGFRYNYKWLAGLVSRVCMAGLVSKICPGGTKYSTVDSLGGGSGPPTA